MRQGGQVAARAERTLLGDERVNPPVEHFQQQAQRRLTDAGMALGQGVGADQHQRARGGLIEQVAHPHRMADEDIPLELLDLFLRDDPVFERAEAGRNPIDDFAAGDKILHRPGRPADLAPGCF